MEYTIRFLNGEPRFDNLGVIKLGCAPSVDINDRIYAQAQLGRNADSFFARVLSFETKPSADAEAVIELCHGGHVLRLLARADETSLAEIDGRALPVAMTSYLVRGEDLQGEYWGAVMMMPLSALTELLGIDEAALPAALTGDILRKNPAISSAGYREPLTFILSKAL